MKKHDAVDSLPEAEVRNLWQVLTAVIRKSDGYDNPSLEDYFFQHAKIEVHRELLHAVLLFYPPWHESAWTAIVQKCEFEDLKFVLRYVDVLRARALVHLRSNRHATSDQLLKLLQDCPHMWADIWPMLAPVLTANHVPSLLTLIDIPCLQRHTAEIFAKGIELCPTMGNMAHVLQTNPAFGVFVTRFEAVRPTV